MFLEIFKHVSDSGFKELDFLAISGMFLYLWHRDILYCLCSLYPTCGIILGMLLLIYFHIHVELVVEA